MVAALGRAGAVTSYNPQDWPFFVLKFSAEGTLKDVYHSGLRPWLAEGFETSFLRFKHARVSVESHDGIMLPEFPVEYADIYCTREGLLHKIIMTSPGLPFANARVLISPWLSRIGKSEAQLDSFFRIVEENPIGYEDRDFGKAPDGFHGGWTDPGKTNYGIGFRNNKNPNQPLRAVLGVNWYKLRSEQDRNRVHLEPIKPPPGYGNESLAPPKKWGPDSTLDKMRALDLDTGEPPEAVAGQRRHGERPPLKTGVPPIASLAPGTPVAVTPPFPWLLVALLGLGFGTFSLLAWAILRRPADPAK